MKRRNPVCLCALLLFALLLCAVAEAETHSGDCGYECEMTWTVTDDGRLDIGGKGLMQDYPDENDVPWKDYRDQITLVAMGEGVKSIGCNAFYGCSNLMRAELPEGLATIRDGAFQDCTSLQYALLPSTVTSIGSSAFEGCGNLSGVAIPAGVMAIGARAFRDCANLADITIPSGVAQIGSQTFYGCSRLAGVSIPAGVTQIGDYAFYGCSRFEGIVIPYGVTSIASSAFEGCSSLRGITIPASVTRICNAAFLDCECLETIEYSGTQEMWEAIAIDSGNDVLDDPDWLTLVFGNTVAGGECGAEPHTVFWTLSRDGALNIAGKGNMKNYDPDSDTPPWYARRETIISVTVESGVRTVGNSAFTGCIRLEDVNIPRSVTSIGSDAFKDCSSLNDVIIQGSVTSVGSGAFQGCAGLTGFSVPVGMEEIHSHTFDGCTALQSVTIPVGVTAVGDYAFNGCAGLTSVSIPITMAEIGEYAFNGCSDLAVRYDGTEEMWRAIRIGGSNDPLSNPGIQYGCTVACGECGADGCTVLWTLSGDGAFFIAGAGNMRNFGFSNNVDAPWYEYLDDIRFVTIGSGVTSIGSSAFMDCRYLESIYIPDSVTSIEESAIRNCSSLTSVTIPAGVKTITHCSFEGCGSLESVTIPAGVTTIEDHAFGSCGSLISINIPDSVRSIGYSAFHHCGGLESFTIPAGVPNIGSSVFSFCEKLESIFIPASVTHIRGNPFSDCYSLSHIWYDGSLEMWNSIKIQECNNDFLGNAELHCRLAVSIECGAGGTVKADKTITDGGQTVTLTVKPAGGYELDSLTAAFLNSEGNAVSLKQDTTSPDKWTFTMPYADVKVTAVFALHSDRYLDEDGLHIPAADVVRLGSETGWNAGWYLASPGEKRISGRVSVSGDVRLILADGADLLIPDGITVPSGSRLTIYAQSAGANMGKLTAGDPDDGCTTEGAGIGGAPGTDCGEIIIVGGRISARGFKSEKGGAGIGGGGLGQGGGTVTIRGGHVTAVADRFAAAIGAGYQGSTANVKIRNGTVIAKNGTYAAAIGGGQMNSSNNQCDIDIEISGGTVTAQKTDGKGAGIGAGYLASSGRLTVSITGGKVTATGGSDEAGIGRYENSGGCAITLGWKSTDDFIQSSSYCGAVTLSKNFEDNDGTVYAAGAVDDNEILAGKTLRFTDKNAVTVPGNTEHGSVTASAAYASPDESVVVTLTPDEGYVPYTLTVTQENGEPQTVDFSLDENGAYTGNFTMPGTSVTVEAAFTPAAVAPTVRTQDLSLTYGYLSGCVSVTAAAPEEHEITAWQWYSCDDRNKTNPVPIEGATGAEYALPTGMNAGTAYYFCTVTATRTDNGQSAAAESDAATVTVGKAEASITPDEKVKIAGKKDPALTATVTGMIGEDTLNYTLTRDEGEDEGVYGIRVTMGDNPNYEVTVDSGTFTIVPPFSGNFILPKNTVTIGASAFEDLTEITGVDAGSCKNIRANAFRGCTGLLQIRVSKECNIEGTAFDGCDSLIAIYGPGGGTAEQSAKKLGIPFADETAE